MEDVKIYFDCVMKFFELEVTLYDYTFTYLELIMFSFFVSLFVYFIYRIFGD